MEDQLAKAGLKGVVQDENGVITSIGDIITAIDNHPVVQMDDILNYIESKSTNVGTEIKLTVNRNGQIMDLSEIVVAKPITTYSPSSQTQFSGSSTPQLPPLPP